jgi:ketosteroid isomerase-like protein
MKNILLLIVLCWPLCFISAQTQESADTQELQTKKSVENFLSMLAGKNPEAIASCFAEDIDWYIFESPKFPWTGRRTKRSEVAAVFKTLFSYFVDGKEKFVMDSFMIDKNEAAIFAKLGRRFKKTDKDFLMYIAIHLKVENGLITKFYLYEQTPVLEKAFE